MTWSDLPGFGLYVHWPFCAAKCPYCDFNSHVAKQVDQAAWRDAFVHEIRRAGQETGDRVLSSIFFGGGTPSLMPVETVSSIIQAARSMWTFSNDIEVTLEANPTSVEASRFEGYANAGVNRVSIGVQSLRDVDLRNLGRLHSVAEAKDAVNTARAVFPRVSFDLIYARQNQDLGSWRSELLEALEMEPAHLSAYQLTIEPGTAFGERHKIGRLSGLPDEGISADMYFLTQEILKDAGLPAYEISNHCRPGNESRHNLIYWRSGDWVGIGPGSHGRLTIGDQRVATETYLSPRRWIDAVNLSGSGENLREKLSQTDQINERIMMGLRLSEGLSQRHIENMYKVNDLVDLGVLEIQDEMVRTTFQGRPVLNAILRELLL